MCFGGDSKPKEPSFPLPDGSQSPVWQNFPPGSRHPRPNQTALASGSTTGGDTSTAMGSSLGTPSKGTS